MVGNGVGALVGTSLTVDAIIGGEPPMNHNFPFAYLFKNQQPQKSLNFGNRIRTQQIFCNKVATSKLCQKLRSASCKRSFKRINAIEK